MIYTVTFNPAIDCVLAANLCVLKSSRTSSLVYHAASISSTVDVLA